MFIFPVLLILMSSILMVIILFLIQGIESNKSSAGEQTYLILLIIACAIIITIILVIFVKSIRRGCCSAEMVSWNIISQPQDHLLEDTIEQSNNTQLHEEVNVMIMPKISLLNGMNIIRPQISSPRLLPIMRSGELIGFRSRAMTSRSVNASQALGFSQNIDRLDLSASVEGKIVPLT